MSQCLARLHLSHGWYGDRPIHGVALVPDRETAALLRRYGLWSRYEGGRWSLYTDRPGDTAALLDGLARTLDGGALRLGFTGELARMASITALPAGARTLPNFSTRHSQLLDDGTRVLLAHTDTADTPGMLYLYPDDLKVAAGAIWSIRFQAREMPWIYFVVNRNGTPLQQPFVRGVDGRTLRGPVPATLPDGEAALRFDTGDESLALNQRPSAHFGLFDNFRSPLSDQMTEVCLVRALPLPDPWSLLLDGDPPGQRISAARTIYL